tara:strand:+ start:481 stop:840 length:360 start_codon:yes stop_codon:yes gene_type:complete
MKKWLKGLAVAGVVWWFLSAILSVFVTTPNQTVEMWQKVNPGMKVEVIASDLSFIDSLLTRDQEWVTLWRINGMLLPEERIELRWSKRYIQPFQLGVYFGLGRSFIKLVAVVSGARPLQ